MIDVKIGLESGGGGGGGGGLQSTDVPDNIVGSFDGRSRLEVVPGDGDLFGVAASEKYAIRVTANELTLVSSDGKTRSLALDPVRHKQYLWQSYATTISPSPGAPAYNANGIVSSGWPASNDFSAEVNTYLHTRFTMPASSAQQCGAWFTNHVACTPNAASTKGGFLFRFVVSPRFTTVHTTSRLFFGMYSKDPRVANEDFSATINHIGILLDPGDTNLCFSSRGPTGGTRQKITLGASFPGNLIDNSSTNRYLISLYCPRSIPNKCFVIVENLTTGATFSQVVSMTTGQDYPDPEKGLYALAYCNNGNGFVTAPGFGFETMQVITGV